MSKYILRLLALAITSGLLTGCSINKQIPAVYVDPDIRYVAPSYYAPGPEYLWSYNIGASNWGWRHPARGWHKRRK